jgi:hypothetical protein
MNMILKSKNWILEEVPYAAIMLLELHEEAGEKIVRLFYNDLQIWPTGCEAIDCTLSEFETYLTTVIWNSEEI